MASPGGENSTGGSHHTDHEWEAQRADFTEYYVTQNMTLTGASQKMRTVHDFHASKRQWEKQCEVWEIRKYLRGEEHRRIIEANGWTVEEIARPRARSRSRSDASPYSVLERATIRWAQKQYRISSRSRSSVRGGRSPLLESQSPGTHENAVLDNDGIHSRRSSVSLHPEQPEFTHINDDLTNVEIPSHHLDNPSNSTQPYFLGSTLFSAENTCDPLIDMRNETMEIFPNIPDSVLSQDMTHLSISTNLGHNHALHQQDCDGMDLSPHSHYSGSDTHPSGQDINSEDLHSYSGGGFASGYQHDDLHRVVSAPQAVRHHHSGSIPAVVVTSEPQTPLMHNFSPIPNALGMPLATQATPSPSYQSTEWSGVSLTDQIKQLIANLPVYSMGYTYQQVQEQGECHAIRYEVLY